MVNRCALPAGYPRRDPLPKRRSREASPREQNDPPAPGFGDIPNAVRQREILSTATPEARERVPPIAQGRGRRAAAPSGPAACLNPDFPDEPLILAQDLREDS
jgi:hypothetical protein